MAHLRAKFHGDPTKTVEKIMFRAAEEYVYDIKCTVECWITKLGVRGIDYVYKE